MRSDITLRVQAATSFPNELLLLHSPTCPRHVLHRRRKSPIPARRDLNVQQPLPYRSAAYHIQLESCKPHPRAQVVEPQLTTSPHAPRRLPLALLYPLLPYLRVSSFIDAVLYPSHIHAVTLPPLPSLSATSSPSRLRPPFHPAAPTRIGSPAASIQSSSNSQYPPSSTALQPSSLAPTRRTTTLTPSPSSPPPLPTAATVADSPRPRAD